MIEMDQINQNVKEIAIRLLGEPNQKLSSNRELRFGSHGSMSVDLEGKWYDHEEMEGGGMISLIQKHYGSNVAEFLRSMGLETIQPVATIKAQPIRTINNNEMRDKANEAEMVTRYSDDFCVMRFKGKVIRPFSKLANGDWVMKRPDHKLPLYIQDGEARDRTLPALIVEGEKSALGSRALYPGVVVCWHGGVSALEQSDWSQLDGYQDFILFPDNDKAGIECMRSLKKILNSKSGRTIQIATPPSTWNEKDDLWDCFDRGEAFDVVEWVEGNELDARQHVIYQKYGDFKSYEYPEMTIMVGDENKTLFHHSDIILQWGAPGSGKSLISQYLCLCLSAGVDFAHYHVSEPQKVLLLDAEMNPRSLQTRFQSQVEGILSGSPQKEELIKRINENFVIVSHYDQPEGLAPLNHPDGRDWYLDLVERVQPTFICWDNLLNLCAFEDNNSAEEFVATINPLLLKMRAENRTTMMLHHAGKSGQQLGSVSKEILLDVSIKISVVEEDEIDDGSMGFGNSDYETSFVWKFKKGRHIYGHDVADINWKYSNGLLIKEKTDRETRVEKVIKMKNEGLSNRQISKDLKVSSTTIDKDVKYAKNTGIYDDEPEF